MIKISVYKNQNKDIQRNILKFMNTFQIMYLLLYVLFKFVVLKKYATKTIFDI